MGKYVSLHTHSCFSFLDAISKPSEIAKRGKEIGYESIAVSDHGACHAHIKFQKECKKNNIKPILGCEVYMTPDHSLKERSSYHLTLLASDNEGLSNLYKMLTIANKPLEDGGGFYFKARISWRELEEYYKGIICLTGCMASMVNRAFVREGYESGKKIAERLLNIFGKEHLFAEAQNVNENGLVYIPEHDFILECTRKLGKELGIDVCATNDSHWIYKTKDEFPHEVMKCIEARGTLATPVADIEAGKRGRMVYRGTSYYLMNDVEMREKFTDEEVDNTAKVAAKCNASIPLKQNHMPKFDDNMTDEQVYEKLRKECFAGFKELGIDKKENKQVYIDRMKVELKDIKEAGLQNYFMIVWDVIRFCRQSKIPTGRGRGSAAGSLTSYLLRITDVDPIEYGLIWERFWNRGRKGSMPDVDLDIAIDRREEVVKYLRTKFGEDRVYPMVTFSTMSVKAALKDVGKALGLSFDYTNELCKHIPHKCEAIDDAIKDSKYIAAASRGIDNDIKKWQNEIKLEQKQKEPDKRKIYAAESKISERTKMLIKTFEIAKRLEDITRQRSSHACALLIADQDIFGKIPLIYDSANKKMLTGFDMYDLEEMGYLKLDILGLKTLSVLTKVHPEGARAIKSFDDPEVFKLITNGDTKGVFQLESPLGKQWCRKLQPKTLLEIADLVSLIRPAVLEAGLADEYIKNKFNPEETIYLHPDLMPIFQKTHGVMVYQEQMIEVAKKFAGFTLEQADALRKATGKKLPEEMAKYKEAFLQGCIKNGYDPKLAEELWGWTEKGASYSFNASHAVSYSMLAYTTAWMKKYYPEKFFCAMLQLAENEAKPQEEISELFYDAQSLGVKVVGPSYKMKNADFRIGENKSIYYGLGHIKHIGASMVKKLKDVIIDTWNDVLKNRHILKKDTLNALICSGSFDYLDMNRRTMKLQIEFLDELTDKEIELFRAIMKQGKYAGRKKIDFSDIHLDFYSSDTFNAAVEYLQMFLEGADILKNSELKVISKGRDERLLKTCDIFLKSNPEEEFDIRQKAAFEIYYLGIPATCSQVDVYHDDRKTHQVLDIKNEREKAGVATIAIVNEITEKVDKKGNSMAFLSIFDKSYMMDAIIFSDAYSKFRHILEKGKVYYFEGYKNRGSFCINTIEAL